MLCDICGKGEAVIFIEGEGKFWRKCNNERMMKLFGEEEEYRYPETAFVYESDGTLRKFRVTHLMLGAIVEWNAEDSVRGRGQLQNPVPRLRRNRTGAKAGEEMIRMLEAIQHDDDIFPEHEINVIREIIEKI